MLPQVTHREWPCPGLIKLHFWCSALGVIIMLLSLYIGGWIQGAQLNAVDASGNPVYAFLDVIKNLVPWLISRSVSGALLTIGHIAFFINFCSLAWARGKRASVSIDSVVQVKG